MSSAQSYTNKVRVVAEAKNKKVNYPGGEAKNFDPIRATLGCFPDFTIQNYTGLPFCARRTGVFRYQIGCFPK